MRHHNVMAEALPAEFDRSAHWRKDSAAIDSAFSHSEARMTLIWRSRGLAVVDHEAQLLRLPVSIVEEFGHQQSDLIFLGNDVKAGPTFALDISAIEEPSLEQIGAQDASFSDLRQLAPLLQPADANLLAYARALTTWHRNHAHCGRCGTATTSRSAGHVRHCPTCEIEMFPRTDPAVIMLVHDGEDRCLLGRQATWPEGVYSTLAGFVEPGESLEMAVAREVLEESGVLVHSAAYHSSQPWPFPTSIMLGFFAEATHSMANTGHDDELEDARWFDLDELRILLRTKEVRLPPPMSISRRLIDDWMEERAARS